MLELIKYCNHNFYIDKSGTKSYYESYSGLCDCPACRNYYQVIKSYLSSLNDFLNQFEIDIEKPIEIVHFEANRIDHTVEYIAYYSVNGSADVSEGDIHFGDVNILVQSPELSPNTEMTEPYFVLEVSNLYLPWSISDDLNTVFPDRPQKLNVLERIKSSLHIK